MHVWMTKISGNKQKLKTFLNNGCLGGIKQGAFVITFCSGNLPLLMMITGGKFSSSFTVGSSCSGGDSIFISTVFTNTSSIKKKANFYCTCEWPKAAATSKSKNLLIMFGLNKAESLYSELIYAAKNYLYRWLFLAANFPVPSLSVLLVLAVV